MVYVWMKWRSEVDNAIKIMSNKLKDIIILKADNNISVKAPYIQKSWLYP